MGDPGRVHQVRKYMSGPVTEKSNREFHTITGRFRKMPFTVISTGIGTDNIDIVLHELDLLVNYDFGHKCPRAEHHALNMIRIGTSGSLQSDLPPGTFLLSSHAIGTDGLIYYYEGWDTITDPLFPDKFTAEIGWTVELSKPYLVKGSEELFFLLDSETLKQGITISATGFYGPQGRALRLPIRLPEINEKLGRFMYQGRRVTNFEMETSALFGLSALMGHQAASVCALIGNRFTGEFLSDYKKTVDKLIEYTLLKLNDRYGDEA